MKNTKTSDAQKRASMKWTKANKESLNLSLNPGTKEVWKRYADREGMPLVGYITEAVEEKAERFESKMRAGRKSDEE